MKTAVSIPDPLYQAADQLARRRRLSRSALYAQALELLLSTDRSDDDITARLDDVYDELDSTLDPAVAAGQAAALREQW